MKQRENPLYSLLFNIIIPVVILNKGHWIFSHHAGVSALLVALAFPLLYGTYDKVKNKRKNWMSALGLLNVLTTGGLALFKMQGIWFAIKEAMFPLLLGVFVYFSIYAKKSFFEYMIEHAGLTQWTQIEELTNHSLNLKQSIKKLFKRSTVLFSSSFFISAILNFILALYIFNDSQISTTENPDILLNKKIADMTWVGLLVIGLPMTFFSAIIFWRFLKKLSQLTQLPIEKLLTTPSIKSSKKDL